MTPWDSILRQHAGIVWQTALRLLGNQPDAADCFQETFLSAMQSASTAPIRNWAGFLQRVATARALDMLRRRALARRRHDSGHDVADVAGSNPGPARQLQNDELADSLACALAQLPERHAQAYCLRHLNDFSYEQIAAELGISVDAVGVDLHRARQRLRELLRPQFAGQPDRGAP